MAPSLLITGGTGNLGRRITPLLRSAGCDLRVLSRGRHDPGDGTAGGNGHGHGTGALEYVTGDLVTGEGVAAAAAGADIVLHLAGGPKGDDVAARNLVRALSGSKVRHLVFVSVIGADRVPLAWFRTKLAAEQEIAGSGIPFTTLRAAQFHDLVLMVVEKMAGLPVLPVPGGLRFEPVDAGDVARRLADLTLGEPSGPVPDLAGPKVYGLGELAGGYLAARGKRRPRLPVRIPGRPGRAYRAGENLARDGAERGKRTWEEFLAERLAERG
jgi:uncharacterized protein YbjT (DUF2867 family)